MHRRTSASVSAGVGASALGGGGDGAEDGPRSAQQVQFTEALVAEVAALLGALGLSRVPVILCGGGNAGTRREQHARPAPARFQFMDPGQLRLPQ